MEYKAPLCCVINTLEKIVKELNVLLSAWNRTDNLAGCNLAVQSIAVPLSHFWAAVTSRVIAPEVLCLDQLQWEGQGISVLHATANDGLLEIHSARNYARNANGALKVPAWE